MCWNDLYRELNTISVEGREGSCNGRCGGCGCGCNNNWNNGCNFHDFPAYVSIPIRNTFTTANTAGNGGCQCGNGIL